MVNVIKLDEYRDVEYTSEAKVWDMITHLPKNEILIISNEDECIRVDRCQIWDPEWSISKIWE